MEETPPSGIVHSWGWRGYSNPLNVVQVLVVRKLACYTDERETHRSAIASSLHSTHLVGGKLVEMGVCRVDWAGSDQKGEGRAVL